MGGGRLDTFLTSLQSLSSLPTFGPQCLEAEKKKKKKSMKCTGLVQKYAENQDLVVRAPVLLKYINGLPLYAHFCLQAALLQSRT